MTTELQMRQGAAISGIHIPPADYHNGAPPVPPAASRFLGRRHCIPLVIVAAIVTAIVAFTLGMLV